MALRGGPVSRDRDALRRRGSGQILLFFHGGGFVMGGVATHASRCAQIARTLDLRVLSVEYRPAPAPSR